MVPLSSTSENVADSGLAHLRAAEKSDKLVPVRACTTRVNIKLMRHRQLDSFCARDAPTGISFQFLLADGVS